MNFHELSKRVAERESGKVQVNIAQIKEIVKITLEELVREFKCRPIKTLKFIRKYK